MNSELYNVSIDSFRTQSEYIPMRDRLELAILNGVAGQTSPSTSNEYYIEETTYTSGESAPDTSEANLT